LEVIGRNKMIEFKSKIPLPVYNYNIFVHFTDDLVASADALASKGMLNKDHGIDKTADGFHVRMPNDSYSFIVLKIKAAPNHVFHEVYHAVSTMFRWIGANHEEEVMAYTLGYVGQMVFQDQIKAVKNYQITLDKQKNP